MSNELRLGHKLEDCLAVVFELEKEKGYVRVKDISRILGITPSAVVNAIARLEDLGFVKHEHYGAVSLTKKGRPIAMSASNKHSLYERFLTTLLVPKNIASRDACQIEHRIHNKTLKQMFLFVEFIEQNPDIADRFKIFCSKR